MKSPINVIGANILPKRLGISSNTSDRILEKSLFLVISATILPKRLGLLRDTSDCIQEKSLTYVPNVTLNASIQLNLNDTR